MSSDKKVAVITGAGSGIGRAAALALNEIGYDVVLAGRRADALQETANLTKSTPPEMMCVPTDIADADFVQSKPCRPMRAATLPC